MKSPDTGEVLGYMVRVYGEILVDQITEGNVARGTLLDLAEPVERGYAVSPRVRVFKHLEPKPATANLEARVIASFSPSIMLAAENFVVLSRGRQGRPGGGQPHLRGPPGRRLPPDHGGLAEPDPRFPKELVAELWVVDVRGAVRRRLGGALVQGAARGRGGGAAQGPLTGDGALPNWPEVFLGFGGRP